MTHYMISNGTQKVKDSLKGLTEEEIEGGKKVLIQILDNLMDEKMTKVQLEDCDMTLEGGPLDSSQTVFLFDPQGIKAKVVGDYLYAGANGDWLELSYVLDAVGIDWKDRFDV